MTLYKFLRVVSFNAISSILNKLHNFISSTFLFFSKANLQFFSLLVEGFFYIIATLSFANIS